MSTFENISGSNVGWSDVEESPVRETPAPSLPEVNSTVPVPAGGSWIRRLLAFRRSRLHGLGRLHGSGQLGDGLSPAGSQFGYTLLSVILLSNAMAILLQALVGPARHRHRARDLAQACREQLLAGQSISCLWLACEAAIIACDLAEVIGTAIALQLLFGIPLIGGALIAALDAFLLLCPDEQGLPIPRSLRRCAADRHRALFRRADRRGRAAYRRGARRFRALHGSRRRIRRCSTSPSASSAPRSCRTISICTRQSCRPAPTSGP